LAHAIGEAAHDVERDVGLKQRAAYLAHRGIDVLFGQRTASRQAIENATKLFRQIVEQCRYPPSCVRTPFQTVLRPRAHRAVGRWPPASGTGRRIEKKASSRSGGVKPSGSAEVNEKCRKVF